MSAGEGSNEGSGTRTGARIAIKFGIACLAVLSVFAASAQGINVIVMDEAADFTHPKLAGLLNSNAPEASGQPNVDDDRNGFVDDILGWNLVSNDGEQMPTWLLKLFQQHNLRIRQLFALNDRIEQGDRNALQTARSNPLTASIMKAFLDKSHGTHVAGIIAAVSQGSARISNLNIFTSSKPPASDNDPTGGNDNNNNGDAKFYDFLSNRRQIDRELASYRRSQVEFEANARRYLTAHSQGVVNMSFGSMHYDFLAMLDQSWKKAVVARGLPPDTARTEQQEANLKYLADSLYKARESTLENLMRAFPNVLFVAAAGNDQENNDETGVTPANASVRLRNVITVAAVDSRGLITDFSNYGAKSVNIAAPGRAISSLAPNGMTVLMSGTSMAAPYVAAVAARIRAQNPLLSAAEVRAIIERTGRRSPSLRGKVSTGAVIDANAALAASRPRNAPRAPINPRARSFELSDLEPSLRLMIDPSVREGDVAVSNDVVRELASARGRRGW